MLRFFVGPDQHQVAKIDIEEGKPLPDFLSGYTEVSEAQFQAAVDAINSFVSNEAQTRAALVASGAAKIETIAGLTPEERIALFGI